MIITLNFDTILTLFPLTFIISVEDFGPYTPEDYYWVQECIDYWEAVTPTAAPNTSAPTADVPTLTPTNSKYFHVGDASNGAQCAISVPCMLHQSLTLIASID